MIKKTFKNHFDLIFQNYTIIDNKEYRLPYYIYIPKTILNFIYLFGGFIILAALIGELFEIFNIKLSFSAIIFLTILIPILLNYLIVYFSPLVKVETIEEKQNKSFWKKYKEYKDKYKKNN
ncbi:hypothetical protein [Aliarcobacter skirrowii]|uniref:Membrane protein n=1 Tax=Aliarcobacter skirrowii CCUG 10374 TaxID=1032239 RepID=A0AAD0WNB5_9BACT|nr:hypothetical protein [Aliarcobacter skirrowii]AXX84611.1 putative membrane protein [Aliarcobacter skirrowii CCUG 10374]KAB0619014.1 hypothetical protein F7P70_10035 [Aliarcobacter skirrowii CCUG 10374]RXI24705.1 hypothetical protein CP959_09720 [Aliarcobacter skirrowii CCUG 10374]SUV14777.1 Uncharacterised protein [Aliarcobacter skirrowii]